MKVHTELGSTTFELHARELLSARAIAKVAAQVRPDDFLYAPEAMEPVITDRGGAHSPVVSMHSSRPDEHRLDALRAALRDRGLGLESCRAYYWRVTPAPRVA